MASRRLWPVTFTGCAARGARFQLDDAASSHTADADEAWEEIERLAAGVDHDTFVARAPTHLASCECANQVFVVELSRERVLAALYLAAEDGFDMATRAIVAESDPDVESIYCPNCDCYLDTDELEITQIAAPIHPDQGQLAFEAAI